MTLHQCDSSPFNGVNAKCNVLCNNQIVADCYIDVMLLSMLMFIVFAYQ